MSVPLESAAGRVLSRAVAADVDLPPFEKSAMDGFAVRTCDFRASANGPREQMIFMQVGESRAGAPFRGVVRAGECVAIYTGAEVPASCDAVVMVEKSQRVGGEPSMRITFDDRPAPSQHVCHRGEDLRNGDTVFERGRRISAIDLSVLAAVGADPAPVFALPRVAVCTTGDELVTARERPKPGEIREGNTHYLAARLSELGANVDNLGIVRDDESALEHAFRAALETHDVLVTTGGVSMGKYDLVGAVLERIGVELVFHRVAIKPGKPLWFGMWRSVPVFGLPGNPVSCLIGLEVFVRPALAKMRGEMEAAWSPRLRTGRWLGGATRENPRQQNLPVTVVHGDDGIDGLATVAWTSSADIVGLTRAAGLCIVPAGLVLQPGDLARYRPLE